MPPTFKGRSLGIVILTILQLIIGVIHVIFGFILLFVNPLSALAISTQLPVIYSIYTLAFGLLTLIFAYGLVRQELGLERHSCDIHFCHSCRCLDASEFTQHSRHSQNGCNSRNHLQSDDCDLPVWE